MQFKAKTGRALNDSNLFPPVAQYHYRKEFQSPTTEEGFDIVHNIPFVRVRDPTVYTNKALLLDYDGTLRKIKGQDPKAKKDASGEKLRQFPIDPSEIELLPNRKAVLQRYVAAGYRLLGVSNQSGIGHGIVTRAQVQTCFDATNALLGIPIEYMYCPHNMGAGGIPCFCRKPNPALGVIFIEKYRLDPCQCIMVGDMKIDAGFAASCGFQFVPESKFFA
jgi:histidinol-phosphate phosphatase family protein